MPIPLPPQSPLILPTKSSEEEVHDFAMLFRNTFRGRPAAQAWTVTRTIMRGGEGGGLSVGGPFCGGAAAVATVQEPLPWNRPLGWEREALQRSRVEHWRSSVAAGMARYCTKGEEEGQKTPPAESVTEAGSGPQQTVVGKVEGPAKLMAVLTCKECDFRKGYSFTKDAYENGVVIIRCSSCRSLHLVADNLGWFSEERKNLETISREHGIDYTRVKVGAAQDVEIQGAEGDKATSS